MTLPKLFRRSTWAWRLVLLVWVGGFLGATWNHAGDLIRGGWLPYQAWNPAVPPALNLYWTSLTFLDPLAVLLLVLRVRWGAWAYLAVIASDVIINASFTILTAGVPALVNFFFVCQAGFLVLVLVTFRYLEREGETGRVR